jgi:hypothetical protein
MPQFSIFRDGTFNYIVYIPSFQDFKGPTTVSNQNIMKKLKIILSAIVAGFLLLLNLSFGFRQEEQLEKMPESLEMEFARSALPPHLRDEASVYLLDPKKGFYLAHKGSNGFICFVLRTEWERAQFRTDLASPISFDSEGAKAIFPAYADVEAMRASGRFTAPLLKDTIEARFKREFYKAPKPGISYMLAPLMRTYDDKSTIVTMSVPHYMFYAPYLTAADLGCRSNPEAGEPVLLGDGKSPHGFAIMFAGEKEKSKIVDSNKELLSKLENYKPYFRIGTRTKD